GVERPEPGGRLAGQVPGRPGAPAGADPPGAIPAPPPPVGGDLVAVSVDLQPAAPRPELGQPAGVEEGPAVGVVVEVRGLLEGGDDPGPGEVVGQPVLGASSVQRSTFRPSTTSMARSEERRVGQEW